MARKNKMVLVSINQQNYYMDGYLKDNLKYVKERVIHHNNMMVCIIDGKVGSGKSTIAAQMAYFCSDGKFTLEHETFTSKETTNVMRNIFKGGSIVVDEAFDQMNRRTSRSSANMLTISLLQRMRVKQVFVFIVLPYIYDLDKNIILGLADTFIHCYRKPFGQRGQYQVYDEEGIKNLWLFGRQSYSYSEKIAKPNFRGKFTKYFPLDYNVYEEKKEKEMGALIQQEITGSGRYITQRNNSIIELKNMGKSIDEICKIVNLKARSIYDILEK